jgi:tight adherence protein B
MTGLPHLMIFLTVSGFMMTIVNLLPSFVKYVQEHYVAHMSQRTRELDKIFFHIKIPYIFGGAVLAGALLGWLTDSWVMAGTCVLVGLVTPKVVVAIWKNIRSAQFDEQLMDALILIGNAMRSGLDIATGIELVTTNMKPPISEEFGVVLNAYRLGGSLEEALLDLTRRIHSRPLDTVVVSIILQRETGGNLIRTFEQLVQTIREESKLQKRVRALSAQGRTQIVFLAFFPWALAGLIYFLSPEMIQPALSQSWGQAAVVGLIFWELIGIFVTKRIVTVDV